MQMVKKILLFIVIIPLSLIIFAPKRELYYLLEDQLLKQDIIINNKEIKSELFTLTLRELEIYVKGIEIAKIEEVKIFSLLLYNTISIRGIKTDSSLYKLMPTKADSLDAKYQILQPKVVSLDINGTFGHADGYLLLDQNKIHLDITEEGSISALKPMLRKGDKGWYYETSL